MEFEQKEPPVVLGEEISKRSFEIIKQELKKYEKSKNFNSKELEVITRLIHTTSCFDAVLDNIFFTKNVIYKSCELLKQKAKIIVDVNMIKVGLNQKYINRYNNEVVCYIGKKKVYKLSNKLHSTRSYVATKLAIKKYKDEPMVLLCGNAPTFIYAAIKYLLRYGVDLNRVVLYLLPVGFVNVIESKEYALEFCKKFGVEAIIMQDRFGGSTLTVAALHAVYEILNKMTIKERVD